MGLKEYFLAWNRFLRGKKAEVSAADALHSADNSLRERIREWLERRERWKRVKEEFKEMEKFRKKLENLEREIGKHAKYAEIARRLGKFYHRVPRLESENFKLFYDKDHVKWDEAELFRELGIDFFKKIYNINGEIEAKVREKYEKILRKHGIEEVPAYDTLMQIVDYAVEHKNFREKRNEAFKDIVGGIPKEEKGTLEDVLKKGDLDALFLDTLDTKDLRKLEKPKLKERAYRMLGRVFTKYKEKADELERSRKERVAEYLRNLKNELRNEYEKKLEWKKYLVRIGDGRYNWVKIPTMRGGKVVGEDELSEKRDKLVKHYKTMNEILQDLDVFAMAYSKFKELKEGREKEKLRELQESIEDLLSDYLEKLNS